MILKVFIKVIAVIFVLHVLLLLFQFSLAGIISKKNPFKALVTMMPAYMTALGTQSSAATIPVTNASTKLNGVSAEIADIFGMAIPMIINAVDGHAEQQRPHLRRDRSHR